MARARCRFDTLHTALREVSSGCARPAPTASVNRLLRRRLQHRTLSTTGLKAHTPTASRLSDAFTTPSSPAPDDLYVPFEVLSPGTDYCRHDEVNLPAPFAPPPPPPTSSHTVSGTSSITDRDEMWREPSPSEPSIELNSRIDEYRVTDAPKVSNDTSAAVSEPEDALSLDHETSMDGIKARRHRIRRRLNKELAKPSLDSPVKAMPRDGRMRQVPLDGRRHANARELAAMTMPRVRIVREPWQTHKQALEDKLGDEHWNPRKKVSPDAMEGIRALHAQYPDQFTTPVLADQFKVSPEAIRRILKGKWRPNAEQEEDRRMRWDKRGEKIWTSLVDQGVHPPKRWRTMGIGTGPRRPAQDRSSRRSTRPETRHNEENTSNEGSVWMRSLLGRIG